MRGTGWLWLALALLLLAGGGAAVYVMTRGLRNNNPGNLRRTSNDTWLGLAPEQTDPEFVQFVSPEYGIRAMYVTLKTYYRDRYGLGTLEQMINRWAPPVENDTEAYIDAVSRRTGIVRNARVTDADFPKLISAIIAQENGIDPYTTATIGRGISLA